MTITFHEYCNYSGNNDNLLINGSNLDIMSESGGVSLQQQQPITLSIQDVDGNNSNGILIAERRGYNRLTDMDSNGNIFERENLAELQVIIACIFTTIVIICEK